MKIEITFFDVRDAVDHDDPLTEKKMRDLPQYDGGYMDLTEFIGLLRKGRFGQTVSATFKISEPSGLEPFIEFTVSSDDAPASSILDGLLRRG